MKISDLIEAIAPVGTTTAPAPAAPAVGGNVADLSNPAVQAAQMAKQKQDKEKQKQMIQTQIKAAQQQLLALQKQQQDLNKSV
jgi:hypothetical protein